MLNLNTATLSDIKAGAFALLSKMFRQKLSAKQAEEVYQGFCVDVLVKGLHLPPAQAAQLGSLWLNEWFEKDD